MYEILFLGAITANVIVDYFVYRRLSRLNIEYEHVRTVTNDIKTESERYNINIEKIAGKIPALLTEHAHVSARALGSQIGYYQGKAQKAQDGQIEGLSKTVEALGPFAELLKGGAPGPGGPKEGYHM